MAKLLLFLLTAVSIAAAAAPTMLRSTKPAPRLLPEKVSHLRFYWHDILSGRNPTAVTVAAAPSSNASSTAFGIVNIIDDPLTISPNITSKLVGRAQGFYAAASQEEIGLIMAMNLAFMDGKYNGSTITVLGRNSVATKVREMPIVGGSGVFRSAKGHVEAQTYWLVFKTGDATVEYNVFVIHQ